MSVVINTNSAATLAAANLSSSGVLLEKSLNRLSSGSKIVSPADDAGGLAVAMKLSATSRRQGAVSSNLGNSISYLQSQDGVLKVAGAVLTRISELKTLYADPTKNSTDRANYDAEFTQLKAQISSLSSETFNGISLFGSSALSVDSTADAGGSTISVGGANLLGATSTSLLASGATALTQWTTTAGSPTVSAGVATLASGTEIRTNASFTSAFEITFEAKSGGTGSLLDVRTNSGSGSPNLGLFDYSNVSDTNWHSVRIAVAANGTATAYLDGSSTPYSTVSTWGGGTTQLYLHAWGSNSTDLRNIQVSTAANSNTNTVATASSLATLSLSTVTASLQDIASLRSSNGAQQSRLQFASEVLSVNKANIEAATSRIVDVDVAAESTTLARYNILMQAGTSMLAQANQSAQIALKLIG